MIDFPSDAPRSKAQLFQRIRKVIQNGPYEMPKGSPYGGTGAPGRLLEDLLGLRSGSIETPDAVGWELKWYTDRTNLITLFHKEADGPSAIMRYMVRKYGWKDKQDRLSFRHTIRGKSALFKIEDSAGQIVVRPLKGNGPVPYWSHAELMAAAGSKLRRLILVKGIKRNQTVNFLQADAYETFHIADFVYEVLRGSIAIDFDCRESKPGSDGLRNHGTKFRISPWSVCRLYLKKERV